MGLLLFRKVFFEAIRDGRKTTTLRRWDRPRCRAGQRVFAPGLGYLQVTSVERVRMADLTTADARADGFPTRSALTAALRELYEPAKGRRPLFRVRFERPSQQSD